MIFQVLCLIILLWLLWSPKGQYNNLQKLDKLLDVKFTNSTKMRTPNHDSQ